METIFTRIHKHTESNTMSWLITIAKSFQSMWYYSYCNETQDPCNIQVAFQIENRQQFPMTSRYTSQLGAGFDVSSQYTRRRWRMQVYIWKEQCFTSHFSWCYYTNLNMTCAITGLKSLLWTWFPDYCRLIEIFELTNTGNRKASISNFVRKIKNEANLVQLCCQLKNGNYFDQHV